MKNIKEDNNLVTIKDWFPVYRALTELELNNPQVRRDIKTIEYLNKLGLQWESFKSCEKYWQRVKFIAKNVHGNVLEIGCATGNVTKYISRNKNVKKILAIDIIPDFIKFLNQLNLNKVETSHLNLIKEKLSDVRKFDCVVISELIEHITTTDEINILEHIKENLANKTEFIITTPIGFLQDPTHIRGFSLIACVIHVLLLYGKILKTSHNSIQQFYLIQFRNRDFILKLYKIGRKTLNKRVRCLLNLFSAGIYFASEKIMNCFRYLFHPDILNMIKWTNI